MYIGRASLTPLHFFLEGYSFALSEHGIRQPNEVPPFKGFHDWTARKLGYRESTAGWCNMILQHVGGDETVAFERFFELLDEFRTETSPPAGP
jgi:hypothetical protein